MNCGIGYRTILILMIRSRMMNERIRELAIQAGAQGIVNRDFIDVEKFTEVVQEDANKAAEIEAIVKAAVEAALATQRA